MATLCAFCMATGTANGSAAVVSQTPYQGITSPVSHGSQLNKKKKPKVETYQERIDRIAQSKRSLLRPLAENQGTDTTCVSGEFTTLSVVYDSLFESIYPILPPNLRATANAQRAQAHRDMERIHVSTLAVTENPMALGADRNDNGTLYRGPISQLIVSDLLKIRDGRQCEAIALENITVSQAVETAFTYIFATIIAPARVITGFIPYLGSPLSGTSLSGFQGYVTYNTLLSIVTLGGQIGVQRLYQLISNTMINQCVAQVTDEQMAEAGRPSDSATFDIPIAPIISETANQLALADDETCKPISELSLSRIVTRTSEYAQSLVQTATQKRTIRIEANRILNGMRHTQIPLNLIPADPADFNDAEQIASVLGGFIPYVGGAPLDIILGLGHNIGQGDDLRATVPLADLTVTKSITAVYYTWYLSVSLFATVGGLLEGQVLGSPTVGFLSPTRVIAQLGTLPLTYGLINYHNVVRSMCLREDDTTGTGRGAENNRDRATKPTSTSASTPTSTPRRSSPNASRSTAPRRSAQRPAPMVPGLPQIPGLTVPTVN